jgi:DNA-directed RNA polymerase II subunit RPB4
VRDAFAFVAHVNSSKEGKKVTTPQATPHGPLPTSHRIASHNIAYSTTQLAPPPPNPQHSQTKMAGLTPLAQTARRRPKPAGDEEAGSVLKLGEMSNSAALSTAAAHELLLKIEEARGKDPKLPLTHNDLITKNNTYLEVFARFKGSDTVQQVTSEAETLTQLAEFERAQLGEFPVMIAG